MKEKREVDIHIRIIGTKYDANLIKRALKSYLLVANKNEQENIKCYLSLIDYAVKKAERAGVC